MALQMIPLTTSPNQSATLSLVVDGAPLTVNITISFNEMSGYWILSISDAANNLLVDSIPMITGGYPAANLLEQQRYLGIGSWYVVNVSNIVATVGGETGYGEGFYNAGVYGGASGEGGMDYPNSTNLGTDFQLWVGDTPSV
jgi:hypothetical protein